jgi:hypothetical protein
VERLPHEAGRGDRRRKSCEAGERAHAAGGGARGSTNPLEGIGGAEGRHPKSNKINHLAPCMCYVCTSLV